MAAMPRKEDGHRRIQSPEKFLELPDERWELPEKQQTTITELLKEQSFTDKEFVDVSWDFDLRRKCEDSLYSRSVTELRHMLADSGLADRLTPEQTHVEKEDIVATLLELRADVLSDDHRHIGGSFINESYLSMQPTIEELGDLPMRRAQSMPLPMRRVLVDPHLSMPIDPPLIDVALLALSANKVTSSLPSSSATSVGKQRLLTTAQSEERKTQSDQRSCQEPPKEVVPPQPIEEPPPKEVVLDDPTISRTDYAAAPVASSVPSVLPISTTERGLLTVGQCMKARIEHCDELMTIHAENAYDSWAVVTFKTLSSGDFDLELTLLADAPCTDQWDNGFLVGAVPAGTSARVLSAAEAPWNWGCFLDASKAPMEVWSGYRGREEQPCKLPSVSKRLLAAQSLRIRCTAGRMSFGVDRDVIDEMLPSNLQRNEAMVPCLILGMATKVVVGRIYGR